MNKDAKPPVEPKYLNARELRAALSSVPDDAVVIMHVVRHVYAQGVHYDGSSVVIS